MKILITCTCIVEDIMMMKMMMTMKFAKMPLSMMIHVGFHHRRGEFITSSHVNIIFQYLISVEKGHLINKHTNTYNHNAT